MRAGEEENDVGNLGRLEWKPKQVSPLSGASVFRHSQIYIQKAQLLGQVHWPGHEPSAVNHHTHFSLATSSGSQGM